MSSIKTLCGYFKDTFAYAGEVHKECGKPTLLVLCDMAFCLVFRGITPAQYRHFGTFVQKPSERGGHLTHSLQNKMQKKYENIPRYGILYRNKYYFYRVYSDFFDRSCYRTDNITADEMRELLSRDGRFIYKPLEGSFGEGVKIYRGTDLGSAEQAVAFVRGLQPGVLEQLIPQHEALAAMYPDAVNPIRVVTLYKDEVCHYIYGTLTLGVGHEFANASDDALFALIDVKTGEVITDAVDYSHNEYKTHPSTGAAFMGFKIPMWDKVLKMLEKAASRVPEMRYLSWDIAMTPTGPVIIEGNDEGGFTGFQFYNFTKFGVDTKTAKLIKPFLED